MSHSIHETHDPAHPPVSYSKAVKEGDAYENHDYQAADVPGIKPHDPAHPPVSYSSVVKDTSGEGQATHDAHAPHVPGIKSHDPTHPPVPYSSVVKDSDSHANHDSHKPHNSSHPPVSSNGVKCNTPSYYQGPKRESSTGKPTPPKSEDVSLDMASDAMVTMSRRVGKSAVSSGFPHPSIARARWAPDPKRGQHADAEARKEWERALADKLEKREWERKTVLEKHCAFFDRDNDGVIWPHDTFLGFYALGFGIILSLVSTFVIHSTLAYLSQGSIIPDPFFRFYINNAYKTKHGSDSGTIDTEGRFIPQKFDDIFAKYSSSAEQDYLTISDTLRMLKGQRIVADPFGWFAAVFEWWSIWYLVWPEDKKLKRDDVRGVFTGELLYRIAEQRKHKSHKHKVQ